jgi:simple sugar transport system substrate-binding protein
VTETRGGSVYHSPATRWSRLAGIATLVLVVTSLAACGAGSTTSNTERVANASVTPSGGLIIALNLPLSFSFAQSWNVGWRDAARAFGFKYQDEAMPNLTNAVPDYTTLFKEAISRHPSAILMGDFVPSAYDPLIKQAESQGIPVVVYDTGLSNWRTAGAIGFAGYSYPELGRVAGAQEVKHGVKHFVCVNPASDNPNFSQECQAADNAVIRAGGTATTFETVLADAANPSAIQEEVEGFLRSHADTDGVYSASNGIAPGILAALKALGRTDTTYGTTNISAQILAGIKDGSVAFAVDVQSYLEAFDAFQIAAQYVRYHLVPSAPILTGPVVDDRSNINSLLATQSRHPGVLAGAS